MLCAPQRTASSSPCSWAKRTASAASWAVAHCTSRPVIVDVGVPHLPCLLVFQVVRRDHRACHRSSERLNVGDRLGHDASIQNLVRATGCAAQCISRRQYARAPLTRGALGLRSLLVAIRPSGFGIAAAGERVKSTRWTRQLWWPASDCPVCPHRAD